jgi:hypothetical protein
MKDTSSTHRALGLFLPAKMRSRERAGVERTGCERSDGRAGQLDRGCSKPRFNVASIAASTVLVDLEDALSNI